ncbi:hypothetical protein [Cellulomonas sp. NPDC058312]|uniref:hypothetical protein n=1 Tax=Cellulomonas sp. NPDC058312 TaxID=3346441 RepID=UPI0036E34B13
MVKRARSGTPRGRVVAVGGVVLLLGACGADADARSGTGEVRHDVEPLLDRVPALAGATSVSWSSGALGDADVPGPSLYWIDAVVELPTGVAADLRASLDLAPATERPDVADALGEELPIGDLLAGAALDDAFSAAGWRSTAYLEAEGDDLVLLVVGE